MFDKVVKVLFFPNISKNIGVICVLGTIIGMGIAKKIYEPEQRKIDELMKKTVEETINNTTRWSIRQITIRRKDQISQKRDTKNMVFLFDLAEKTWCIMR